MIAEKMKPYVKNNSAIRMMFEEGNRLRAMYGADKVYEMCIRDRSEEMLKEASSQVTAMKEKAEKDLSLIHI